MFTHPYHSHENAPATRRHVLAAAASQQRLAWRLRARPGTTRDPGGRVLVWALTVATALVLVVALAACGAHGAGQGPAATGNRGHTVTGNNASGRDNGGTTGQRALAGEWVGPVPGDEGECGEGSGEWIFDPDNATYQFDAIYDSGECGYQSNGTYQVQGNSIDFQPQNETAFTAAYSFDDGDLVLCDAPGSAQCYDYQSQPMQ